jgi:hypothetical protein
VLFIGTQFRNLYTAVDTPARAACMMRASREKSEMSFLKSEMRFCLVSRLRGKASTSPNPMALSVDLRQLDETFAILDVAFRQNVPAASFRYFR